MIEETETAAAESTPLTQDEIIDGCTLAATQYGAGRQALRELLTKSIDDKLVHASLHMLFTWDELNTMSLHHHAVAVAGVYLMSIYVLLHWVEHALMHIEADGSMEQFKTIYARLEKEFDLHLPLRPLSERMINDGIDKDTVSADELVRRIRESLSKRVVGQY